MASEYETDHEHELDPEYLAAADATVLEITASAETPVVELIVPCPTCSEPLRLSADVRSVSEADVELPLEDVDDQYD